MIEDAFAALGQRAPGFGLDLVGGVPRVQLTLLHKWMEFYLIDHRGDAGFINQLLQMRYRKLHTPMLLVSPCCCSSISACRPRRNGR